MTDCRSCGWPEKEAGPLDVEGYCQLCRRALYEEAAEARGEKPGREVRDRVKLYKEILAQVRESGKKKVGK